MVTPGQDGKHCSDEHADIDDGRSWRQFAYTSQYGGHCAAASLAISQRTMRPTSGASRTIQKQTIREKEAMPGLQLHSFAAQKPVE